MKIPDFDPEQTRIFTGDCRAILSTMPERSVQMVCTSLPYHGLRSYGIGIEGDEIGMEPTPDSYVAQMVDVFRGVKRVLRDDGTVWLNLDDCYDKPITAIRAIADRATKIVGHAATQGSVLAAKSARWGRG